MKNMRISHSALHTGQKPVDRTDMNYDGKAGLFVSGFKWHIPYLLMLIVEVSTFMEKPSQKWKRTSTPPRYCNYQVLHPLQPPYDISVTVNCIVRELNQVSTYSPGSQNPMCRAVQHGLTLDPPYIPIRTYCTVPVLYSWQARSYTTRVWSAVYWPDLQILDPVRWKRPILEYGWGYCQILQYIRVATAQNALWCRSHQHLQ